MANEQDGERLHRCLERTPDDLARLQQIRAQFQATQPGIEELVASGDYDGPIPLGIYQDLLEALTELRRSRERDGLTLADIADRSGMDRGAISRLENGHNANPTLETLVRYAAAMGKRLGFTLQDAVAR